MQPCNCLGNAFKIAAPTHLSDGVLRGFISRPSIYQQLLLSFDGGLKCFKTGSFIALITDHQRWRAAYPDGFSYRQIAINLTLCFCLRDALLELIAVKPQNVPGKGAKVSDRLLATLRFVELPLEVPERLWVLLIGALPC